MNAAVWLVWALAGAAITLSARHPLYAAVMLAIALLSRESTPGGKRALSPVLLVTLPLFGAVFNALNAHVGDTVLFSLPVWLPLIGGPITAEALAYGAVSGLSFAVLLVWFGVFVARVPARELAHLAPRSFHAVALVVTLALGLAPATRTRLREIQASQAARGHRPRGVRDWLPLWVPLLVAGLEQASQLAEAMMARGYASATRLRRRDLALIVAGLIVAALGGGAQLTQSGFSGLALMSLGLALFLGGLALSGRAVGRTRYRDHGMRAMDWTVLGLILAASGSILFGAFGTLAWDPYPTLLMPSFQLGAGLCMLVLLAPALADAGLHPTSSAAAPSPRR
ncbi:MAG: energy-coupling factor transporter transmembrane component T [Thermoflexales bacterium]